MPSSPSSRPPAARAVRPPSGVAADFAALASHMHGCARARDSGMLAALSGALQHGHAMLVGRLVTALCVGLAFAALLRWLA